MKLWQAAIAVTVAGGVAYVGYSLVKRASLEGKPINESNALNPADKPVKAIENMEGVIIPPQVDKPSNWRAPRGFQSLSFDGPVSRFAMRDAEPPSFIPLATVNVGNQSPSGFMPLAALADIFRPTTTIHTPFGDIQAREGETAEQATSRYLRSRPDVAAAHGL